MTTAPHLLHDLPEEADSALWSGIADLSGQLVGLLHTWARASRAPLLVCGDWGAGKTTLLRAMERRLRIHTGTAPPVIWFDAWRHEGEGALLPALVRAIWDQLPADVRADAQNQALLEAATRTALQMGARAVGAIAAAAGLGLVAGLAKATVDSSKKPTQARKVAPEGPPSQRLVGQLHQLLALGWPSHHTQPNPIVFIDDLDRCSPEGALELLDQVRALLAATERGPVPIRFVMAMDRDVLLKAVASKYRNIDRYDANRFLEKMFPLAFNVPVPPAHEVSGLLQHYLSGDSPVPVHHVSALNDALSPGFFANPRLMKRCVNRFRLVTHFEANAQHPPSGDHADRTLARWIAATERWPDLRRALRDHDDRWWRALAEATATGTALPGPDAEQLFDSRGVRDWLKREVFDNTDAVLSDLRTAEQRVQRWGL